MPVASRWMIKISMIYLLLGIVMGALILIHKAYPLHPATWQLLPMHIEVTIFGWIIQFTLGAAYWMFPRFLETPQRGPEGRAYLMVIVLNIGILLMLIDSLVITTFQLQLIGRSLELLAVLLFVSLHWNRVVTYRNS